MADNVAVTAGTGTAIAADEVVDGTLGTVKVQFVKLMDGTLDGTTKLKVLAGSTTVSATDPAIPVQIHPNSVNANGQAVMASSAPVVIASNQTTIPIGGNTVTPSSTMTRAATTPTYASGQLFANSTVAGSVVNLSWSTAARVSGGSGVIIGAAVQKSGNTTTGAAFRIHLFTVAPTYVTNGDTSPLTTVVVASGKGYLGYIDITTMVGFSDVSWGSGAPDNTRGGLPFVAVAQTLFGLIEARGAYVGVSGEVLTVFLDILQD